MLKMKNSGYSLGFDGENSGIRKSRLGFDVENCDMKKLRLGFALKNWLSRMMVLVLCAVCGIFIFAGCGRQDDANGFKLYYLRSDKTGLYPVAYEVTSVDTDEKVYEVLGELAKDSTKVEYIKPISSDMQVTDYTISSGDLSLYFNNAYADMDVLKEVLVRAAIVRSLTQLEGVDSVSIYVAGKPLEDADGKVVGPMSAARFVSDFNNEALQSTTLTLYFASYDGLYLVPEKREVFYSSNISLEHSVIDQLMSGSDNTNLLGVMPADVRLLSVNTTGGVCYVNFNEAFLNVSSEVTDNVVVYAVVNSLTSLEGINQVVITVNGNVPVFATEDLNLSVPLSKNEAIINAPSYTTDGAPTSGVMDVLHGTGAQ